MRLIQTGDWHLGKKLFKQSRFDEHQAFLNWLSETLKSTPTDILLICGDIFDVPNPPHFSLKQFYRFIENVQKNTDTQIVCLAGNHDSANLIEAASPLVSPERVTFRGHLSPPSIERECPHRENFLHLKTSSGEWALCTLPYFRFHELQSVYKSLTHEEKELADDELALEALRLYFQDFHQWCEQLPKASGHVPRILAAHHLFGSFQPAGSEQGLSLSGLESLPLFLTDDFDYVALGHIHRPQCLKSSLPEIQYAGSPLPLRFSEVDGPQKRVLQVDFSPSSENHVPRSQSLSLPEFRQFLRVEGKINVGQTKTTEEFDQSDLGEKLEQKLKGLKTETLPPFLELKAWPNSPCPGLSDIVREKLSQFYQQTGIDVHLLSFMTLFEQEHSQNKNEMIEHIQQIRPEKLFHKFYQFKYPEGELTADLESEFQKLLENLYAKHESKRNEEGLQSGDSP